MKAVESSYSYRVAAAGLRRAGHCAADSLTGRAVLRAAKVLGPVFGDSRSFGTGRIAPSTTAGDQALPLSATAFVRPVLAARGAIERGAPGRLFTGLAQGASSSVFAGGQWLRVLGAAAVGLGCGLVSSKTAAGLLLIVVGVVLALAGPTLLSVLRSGLVGRAFGLQPAPAAGTAARVRAFAVPCATWVMLVAALAAGALAGAGPHTKGVLAAAVVIAAVGAVLWRPQFVLLVAAAFPWVDWVARHTLGGIGPLWDDALLVLSAALIVWSVLVLRRDLPRAVPATMPVLLMLAAAGASIVVNRVPTGVGIYALRVLFEPILFYFVGFLLPKDRRWLRWTIGVFIATATLLALHGIYQYVTHAPMPASWVDVTETSIGTRAYSVVQNPNVLGAILAMGALLTGSLTLSRAFSGPRRIAVTAACVLQLVGLAVTFSRGAWIGFVVGAVAVLILAYRPYILVAAAAVIVAWFAAPQVFVQRLLFSFSSTYAAKSSTGLGRVWRWEAALHHIADKPLLGLGLGTFGGTAAYMYGYWGIWVDNFYLQMGAEGGLLLLVLFLWLLLRGGKGLVRGYRDAGDPYAKALAAGMLGAFVAVIVADFFEADWETLAVGVLFWFLAGLVTSALLERRAGERRSGEGRAPAATE